jgi:pSer/pThr/pTyr-binding forkhead associated (FHA) protein
MWILRGTAAADALTFRLPHGAAKTVGRAPRADFIISTGLVSRLHCRIVAGKEGLEVEDLSSTNGTFVNGRRVKKAHLGHGDRLRVGRVELTVERQQA